MNSFFVPPEVAGWASSDAAVQPGPRLGHEVRSCGLCRSDWGPTRCTTADCASNVFTVSFVEPVPLHTRVMDRLRPKPTPPLANAAQRRALRDFQGSVTRFADELAQVDELLRGAVRAGVEELIPAQGLLNTARSITGDASPDRIAGLSLALRALSNALTPTIQRLDKDTPK
jgi:hypothetical protein